MIKYFKNLIQTLYHIERELTAIRQLLESVTTKQGRGHSKGSQPHIRTGHWND